MKKTALALMLGGVLLARTATAHEAGSTHRSKPLLNSKHLA